jgi:predicted nucleotidyltransferase
METPIPISIQPLIDAYLHALEPLHTHFYGIYIYGSIALGAFEELASDIDIIALTQGEWSSLELKQLEALHRQLIKVYPLGKRLEVFYSQPSLYHHRFQRMSETLAFIHYGRERGRKVLDA